LAKHTSIKRVNVSDECNRRPASDTAVHECTMYTQILIARVYLATPLMGGNLPEKFYS